MIGENEKSIAKAPPGSPPLADLPVPGRYNQARFAKCPDDSLALGGQLRPLLGGHELSGGSREGRRMCLDRLSSPADIPGTEDELVHGELISQRRKMLPWLDEGVS